MAFNKGLVIFIGVITWSHWQSDVRMARKEVRHRLNLLYPLQLSIHLN